MRLADHPAEAYLIRNTDSVKASLNVAVLAARSAAGLPEVLSMAVKGISHVVMDRLPVPCNTHCSPVGYVVCIPLRHLLQLHWS